MKITRVSMLSGIERTVDLPVTEEQVSHYMFEGALLQDAFPNLSAADREFIKSGIVQEEWDAMFPEEE